MKRLLALFLTLAMMAGLLTGLGLPAGAAGRSGSGTAADPYLITTAAELNTLAAEVNAGNPYTGYWFRLTDDVEVTDWTPIGKSSSQSFSGYFDGAGHTVTIENLSDTAEYLTNLGLFGYVYGGTIMNVTVAGEVAKTYTNGSVYYVGGVAGNLGSNGASRPGQIINCVNHARVDVTTDYEYAYTYVGGIVGHVNGTYSRVMNCYNTGEVVSSRNAGGIVGYADGGRYSYNYSAAVPTQGKDGYVGGFSGGKCYGTAEECYGADTWTADTDGAAWVAAANAQTLAVGDETVTGQDFWRLGSTGAPEANVCAHTPRDGGTVVAPTCTEKGYTIYTCATCGAVYKGDRTLPLGHDYKTVTTAPTCTTDGVEQKICQRTGCGSVVTTVLPAAGHRLDTLTETTDSYWEYKCSVCGYLHRVTREVRHSAMKLVGVTAELVDDSDTYPWTYNASTGELQSENQLRHDTTSQLEVILRAPSDFTLTFGYAVTGEANYDRLYILVDGETVKGPITSSENGERTDGTLAPVTLSGGTHTLIVKYVKNGSISCGDDTSYVYGLEAKIICDHDWVAGTTVAAACETDGYTPYTCSKCGDSKEDDIVPALGHDDITDLTPATCTTSGEEVRTCRRCGRVDRQVLLYTGHKKGTLVREDDNTWTYQCLVCGEEYSVDKKWNGTYQEPAKDEDGAYLVGTAAELAWLNRYAVRTGETQAAAFSASDVKLTADIYMTGYSWIVPCFTDRAGTYYFGGAPFYNGGPYAGTFDGQGHTIYGLEITWGVSPTVSGRLDSFGFFGRMSGGTVKNLGLVETIRLTNQDSTYTYDNWLNVGGVAGFVQKEATVTQCYVDLDVDIGLKRGSEYKLNPAVGGIVGALSINSRILDCYTTGSIRSEASGYITMGGIAGSTRSGANLLVTRCWSDVSLTAVTDINGAASNTSYVGGIIGKVDAITTGNLPEVSYCFALNPVLNGSGGSNVLAGRVVGYGQRFGNEGSYNFALDTMELKDVTATPYDEADSGYRSGWGRDITKEKAMMGTTYTNVLWNYDEETEEEQNIWHFSGKSYPTLAWQEPDGAEEESYAVTVSNPAGALVSLADGTYTGKVRFTVTSSQACAVMYTTDDGESYTLLPAAAGEGNYSFTLDPGADAAVVVALKGDVNLDGKVNSADAAMAKRFAAGLEKPTLLQTRVLGAEKVTGITALRLQRAVVGLYELGW